MNAIPRVLRLFRSRDGSIPFSEWIMDLADERVKQKIIARLARVRAGNFGDVKSVGTGVHELKISFGPGYRIYFGQHGAEILILLCGGDKSSQDADIKKAKKYWQEYKSEKGHVEY